MPRTSAVINNRNIDLSNLDKPLFPEDGIIKAEVIEYYLKIAPVILRHIRGRPLSFVRYPDGVNGQAFFQKNQPGWAPDWIPVVSLGKDQKTAYMLASEDAALAWLANLACLEIHQMHARAPRYDIPDYIVYDLDPPEGYPFPQVAEVAFNLRDYLAGRGHNVFVKTTGGKGLHLLTPIEPQADIDAVFERAQALAQPFVEEHGRSTTLHIKKEARKGKVLVDIYRNRRSQTIVSAYSLRGRAGAPVSMPLTWERLRSLENPLTFNLRTAPESVLRDGDAWETIDASATPLIPGRHSAVQAAGKPSSEVPDALRVYASKRSFSETPEPPPEPGTGSGDAFVIHRHHASRLHYDLRLEREGTLKSWAIPKGLPPRPGVKRLGVATEDHPLKYLSFEGTIPKGQYGAGRMWVFASGKYEISKEKKDGFYFRLHSHDLDAEYRCINTKGTDWLILRVDTPQVDWLRDPIEPMLAESRQEPPASDGFLFEVKWDGIRALVSLDEGTLTIRSRSLRDITGLFPELGIPDQAFRAASALFDAEIVCLDPNGRPVFQDVITRLHHSGGAAIERARRSHPAVCYLFDCLYLDGRPLVHEPLWRRREWLADAVRENPVFRVSEALGDGNQLFDAARGLGLEGIMAKQADSPYQPGRRSPCWLKIKVRQTTDRVVIGYTRGKGDRDTSFGALHLARYIDGALRYSGKVGTGFDDDLMKSIMAELKEIPAMERPVPQKPLDDAQSTWVQPKLVCEVRYASLTRDGILREPVFVRLRPDLVPEDCI